MRVKTRINAHDGLWCVFLLPAALFSNFWTSSLELNFVLFVFCSAWLIIIFEDQRLLINNQIPLIFILRISFVIMSILCTAIFAYYQTSFNIFYLFFISYLSMILIDNLYCFLLIKCRGSFSYGEAAVVAEGISIFIVGCFLSWYKYFQKDFAETFSEVTLFLQILLLGCFGLICILYNVQNLRSTINFYVTCVIFGAIMYVLWTFILHQEPVFWLLSTSFKSLNRVTLMLFWIASTTASILFVIYHNTKQETKASTNTRKYFHFIIVIVCLLGIIMDSELLFLATVVAFCVFLILEIIRLLKIPPVGPLIDNSFQLFLDEKDSGILILTHIYLLIGCSSPLWLCMECLKSFHISALSGLISVGIGDTAAAIIGSNFGKHKWSNSEKSVEGTVAAILMQILFTIPVLYLSHSLILKNCICTLSAIVVISITEAKTDQVDNLVLPLLMYSFLRFIE